MAAAHPVGGPRRRSSPARVTVELEPLHSAERRVAGAGFKREKYTGVDALTSRFRATGAER